MVGIGIIPLKDISPTHYFSLPVLQQEPHSAYCHHAISIPEKAIGLLSKGKHHHCSYDQLERRYQNHFIIDIS